MGVAGFSLFWKVFVLLFGVFVDEVWRPACAGLRECTRVGYESALRCHVLPRWSGVDLDSVTVDGVESWLWSFDKAGAARKSWAVFRAVMRLAFRRGVTDNDVTRREIRLPRVRRYEPRVLTASEVRRLLRGFYGHPLEAWLLPAAPMFAHRMVPFGLAVNILDVCPLETHTIPLTSIGGRSSVGSTYSHCTLLQLSPAKEPEYLTSIIMPVWMTVRKAIQARM